MGEPISPRRTTPTCQTKIRVHSVPLNGAELVSRGVALPLAALPAADEVISGFLWLCVNDDGQECFQDKVQSNMSHLRTGTPPSQDRIDGILKENFPVCCFVQIMNTFLLKKSFLLHRPGLLLKVKEALLKSGGNKFLFFIFNQLPSNQQTFSFPSIILTSDNPVFLFY